MANLTDFIPGADLIKVGLGIIDKIIPDPTAKAAAQIALLKQEQDGELDAVKVQMSAIIAEANSPDPWTSRARPSFLYVVYLLILFALPMGILSAWSPETAIAIANGMKAWLAAIPSEIIELFKWVMLGYIGGRSFEKVKGAA